VKCHEMNIDLLIIELLMKYRLLKIIMGFFILSFSSDLPDRGAQKADCNTLQYSTYRLHVSTVDCASTGVFSLTLESQ